MYNNPYLYTRFMPNPILGVNAARMSSYGIPMGANAIRGGISTIPNMGINMARGASGSSLFSRLGGMFSSLKNFNWGGLINNTSKTIGVINQSIPLVKQVGPMVKNMRSVMKIASIFKDETDPVIKSSSGIDNKKIIEDKKKNITTSVSSLDNNINESNPNNSNNSPVFFVN